MKKNILFALFFILSFVMVSPPALAAHPLQLVVDGVVVKTDISPEMKNNRLMVPLRVVSENLGAQVKWAGPYVTLTKKNLNVTIAKNNFTAVKNGKTIALDAKPYLKNNRLFVPLRFVAETLGCSVGYQNSTVTVNASPLIIDGVKINTLQQEYHMTMGGVVQHVYGSAYNESIYNLIVSNSGAVVEEPAEYDWFFYLDNPGSYYKRGQYDFLDKDGKTIRRFDIYTRNNAFPAEMLVSYPKFLVYDATTDKWRLFGDTANQNIWNVMDNAFKNGFVKIISDTVV
ncbi:copper amine oxidase N-terminal domain-containing protein [Paenibacillus gansuensis]|uniref:Copper amine oxidase N-terminal domain-containing protein n=1 Tax=Paenibacillus gansuensis TaxID=306542 RepID=A0ABW5P8N6_9BACL